MKTILFLLTILSLSAHATPFSNGDAKRGGELFEKYDCNSCHRNKLGGDGSAIFTRADRTVRSADDLIVQMERCSGAIGKQLSSQEKQDLAAWLNQRYYHFK